MPILVAYVQPNRDRWTNLSAHRYTATPLCQITNSSSLLQVCLLSSAISVSELYTFLTLACALSGVTRRKHFIAIYALILRILHVADYLVLRLVSLASYPDSALLDIYMGMGRIWDIG